MPRYSLILAKFAIRWGHLQASLSQALWSLRLSFGGMPAVAPRASNLCEQPITVKCFVGQRSAKRHVVNQWRYSFAAVGLPRKQEEANESAHRVHQCHVLVVNPLRDQSMD